jgi:aspartyl-tRNA(Asn)/glutamyl-tRNA(Gln) amidotransferase subunit A
MDTVGPISRTTADCAMTLGAIAGYDSKDPLTWNVPVPDYLSALTNDIAGLRVGVITERVHTDAVETEVGNAAISSAIIASDVAALNRDNISTRLDQFDHNNQVRMLMGSILPAAAYQKATRLRQALRQQILDALERVDVLVMPTSSIPAPVIPERAGIGSKQEVIDGFAGRRSFTSPFNLANTPALSINCGFTSQNLPIGLQIAGKPFDETTIFQVAHAYEQATDWHTRRPSV